MNANGHIVGTLSPNRPLGSICKDVVLKVVGAYPFHLKMFTKGTIRIRPMDICTRAIVSWLVVLILVSSSKLPTLLPITLLLPLILLLRLLAKRLLLIVLAELRPLLELRGPRLELTTIPLMILSLLWLGLVAWLLILLLSLLWLLQLGLGLDYFLGCLWDSHIDTRLLIKVSLGPRGNLRLGRIDLCFHGLKG